MLSKNSFFLSAIVGSIVHMTVGGPLDCISGPCLTVEGVGKLMLGMYFYPFSIPIQNYPIPNQSQHNPIPSQASCKEVGSTPSGRIEGSISSWEFLLERPLPVNTGDDQNIANIYLWFCTPSEIKLPKSKKKTVSLFQICTTSAKGASQRWNTQCF